MNWKKHYEPFKIGDRIQFKKEMIKKLTFEDHKENKNNIGTITNIESKYWDAHIRWDNKSQTHVTSYINFKQIEKV